MDEKDLVLQKTRWSASTGNALEQILKAQNITTLIIVRGLVSFCLDLLMLVVVWSESIWCRHGYCLSTFRSRLRNICDQG